MTHDSAPNTDTPEGYLINRFTDNHKEFLAFKELVAKTLQGWWETYALNADAFTLNPDGFENMSVLVINKSVHFVYNLNATDAFVISVNKDTPVITVYVAAVDWYRKHFSEANIQLSTCNTYECINKTLPEQPCIMVNSFLKVARKVEKALGIAFVNKVAETTGNDSAWATLAEASTTFTNLRNRYAALSNNANPPIDIQALVSKLTPAEAAFLFKLIDKVPE